MKRIASGLAAALTLVAVSGCIVVPPRHRAVAVVAPPVVYVEPTYASPGPGWVWQAHPQLGWGWYHRDRGWHRGWR